VCGEYIAEFVARTLHCRTFEGTLFFGNYWMSPKSRNDPGRDFEENKYKRKTPKKFG
jgi:hypothetical protein